MNTLFRTQRIERLLDDLKGLMIRRALPLEKLFVLEGRFDNETQAAPCKKEAAVFPPCGQWSGRNSYFWFFTDISLPDGMEQEALALRVSTAVNQQPDTALLSTFVSAPQRRWDLMNPQFMLFVNGRLRHGMDVNHTEVLLEPEDYADGRLRLDFQAYTGLTDASYGFLPELCIVDPAVKAFYYDALTLTEAALALPEQDTARLRLLFAVNESLNLLDLRSPGSQAFYDGIRAARGFLTGQGFGRPDPSVTVTCIGHTHIDLAWLWDEDQTRLKAQRSFATVLALMERHPGYVFMHTSPQLYAWLKQDNPALYEQVRERIREGRWEPEGAMWVEADCNLPCGEALVRQIVYGKRFIREEFGLDCRVLWLPDVFGYSAAMPQLLKKAGIDCFVTSKISWNMLNSMPYDTFLWKGIDGTGILTSFISTPELGVSEGNCGATYNGVLHPETVYGTWKQYKQKEINRDVFLCYGYGDGGGGPTEEMLEKLERLEKGVPGFPTVKAGRIQPYFRELAQRMQDQKYLPEWTGELYLELHQGTYTSQARIKRNNRRAEEALMCAETLQGILHAAAVCAAGKLQPPGACEASGLHSLWETLLLNQFHDILPGSCIGAVYEQSERQFAGLFRQTEALQSRALNWLACRADSPCGGYLLYNPVCFDRNDVVELPAAVGDASAAQAQDCLSPATAVGDASAAQAQDCLSPATAVGDASAAQAQDCLSPATAIGDASAAQAQDCLSPAETAVGDASAAQAQDCLSPASAVTGHAVTVQDCLSPASAVTGHAVTVQDCLWDTAGQPLPCQRLANGGLLAAVTGVPGFGYTQVFTAPPMKNAGNRQISGAGDEAAGNTLFRIWPVSTAQMENQYFLLEFNGSGRITRLYDKRAEREVLKRDCCGNQLVVYEDRPRRWDTWNIDMYYEEKSWPVTELLSAEVTERGPVRYAVAFHYRYHRSEIRQTVRLYAHIPRIDFLTEADWREDASLLKAEFPVRINADFAAYEIQYGSVRRPTHANTSWEAAKYEVCAHKWADLSEGGYGVSLMNDCKYGYSVRNGCMSLTLLKAGMAPDPGADRGQHRFTYSLYPHEGSQTECGVIQAAQALNVPLLPVRIKRQSGPLPETLRFFSCSLPNITLDCIKKAEDGNALILRFYENGNRHCHARFTVWFPLSRAAETDLLEQEIRELTLTDPHSFELAVEPFSVVTCKLELKQGGTV